MIFEINPEIIIFSKKIQNLCMVPYYGHSEGCPNFGKKRGCPPRISLINEVLDFSKKVYVIYTEFEVEKFAEKIRKKYPSWSDRQIYNPRYWQPVSRKKHREEIELAMEKFNLEKVVWPEAHGINVTNLMQKLGIKLNWDWPPKPKVENKVYTISIGGFEK